MPSTSLAFASAAEHRAWLEVQSVLPAGFRAGTASLAFTPQEAPRQARMNLTILSLERPTSSFALKLTRNAFPGAPVVIGRRRLAAPRLAAVVVNNKVSNVCAPGGVEAAERVPSGSPPTRSSRRPPASSAGACPFRRWWPPSRGPAPRSSSEPSCPPPRRS
jgi:hypothetical protein